MSTRTDSSSPNWSPNDVKPERSTKENQRSTRTLASLSLSIRGSCVTNSTTDAATSASTPATVSPLDFQGLEPVIARSRSSANVTGPFSFFVWRFSSAGVPNASRVPLTNSAGTRNFGKCSTRSFAWVGRVGATDSRATRARAARSRIVGRDHRADPAAHRSAAEHEPIRSAAWSRRASSVAGFAHGRFEHGRAIRCAAARGFVREVEPKRRNPRVGQRVGNDSERRRVHVGARAVREQHGAIRAALRPLIREIGQHPVSTIVRETSSRRASSSATVPARRQP